MSEDVWTEENTSGGAIASALRELLRVRHAENEGFFPARVLNLVVVVDHDQRAKVAERLERVGRNHASRTVLCAIDPERKTLEARAAISYEDDPGPGSFALMHESVEIELGEWHLEHLDTIVDPVLLSDMPTLVWSPYGHPEAIDVLLHLAHVVLLDSADAPDAAAALERAAELSEHAYVVDLAWLRSTPWRERISAAFDPVARRPGLREISGVTVRHQPESGGAALLFAGWLASRLGWEPQAFTMKDGALHGQARAESGEVDLCFERQAEQGVPGLAGVTVNMASGESLSLDRASGGLAAVRRQSDGSESRWTVLGASRGEGGILGEGVRQALLRDPTFGPALESARAMVP